MALLDHEDGAEFPYYKDDVFEALMKAISTISGMKIEKADKLSGHILAKAGVSLMSWGENIPISVTELSAGRTRVSVTSTPKTGILFGGAFDLGKNRRNIEKILEATSNILAQKPSLKTEPSRQEIPGTPAERISNLKELLDRGLITKEEFEEKRGDILSQI